MPEVAKKGIEGSGYDYNDRVMIDDGTDNGALAHVRGIHSGGKKIDVQIDKSTHKEHNRVVTLNTSDVMPQRQPTQAPAEQRQEQRQPWPASLE